jgi:hypothetical protein
VLQSTCYATECHLALTLLFLHLKRLLLLFLNNVLVLTFLKQEGTELGRRILGSLAPRSSSDAAALRRMSDRRLSDRSRLSDGGSLVQSPQRQQAAAAAAQQQQPQLRTLQRGPDSVGVTLAALSEVSQRHAELTQELHRREVLLQSMGEVSDSICYVFIYTSILYGIYFFV